MFLEPDFPQFVALKACNIPGPNSGRGSGVAWQMPGAEMGKEARTRALTIRTGLRYRGILVVF